MVDKEILKKHNLKAVPFSCIGEGETFLIQNSLLEWTDSYFDLWRVLISGRIYYIDDLEDYINRTTKSYRGKTVYVPVWRPCN